MQNLAISINPIELQLIQRVKTFVELRAFSKIQPVGFVNGNVFDLTAILCSVKNNYPFGYCPSNLSYVSNVVWNWSLLPKDLPITKLAFSLVLGVECFSTTVLLNVGRKKIKRDDKWTHRPCTTGIWYQELTSTIDLSKLTDEEILNSIKTAQKIIDLVCSVSFSDSVIVADDSVLRGCKYEARRVLSSLYMLDISTEMPMSFNDRIEFMKLPKPYAYTTAYYSELEYSRYFSNLLDRLPVKTVADLMLDLIPHHHDSDLILAVLSRLNHKQLSQMLFADLSPFIARRIDSYEHIVHKMKNNQSSPEDVLAFSRYMPKPVLTNYLNKTV